jgi:hypothetical protein
MVAKDYAAILREAAEFFDSHPYLPLPETARILTFYYEHPTPIEIRWLTEIATKEGSTAESSTTGLNLWTKKLGRGSLAFVLTPSTSKPS